MQDSLKLPLPPTLVKRLERQAKADIKNLDNHEFVGQLVTATVGHEPLKAFGDEGQVSRWKNGENPNLARLVATDERKKRMARALLESCEGVTIRTVFEIKETA